MPIVEQIKPRKISVALGFFVLIAFTVIDKEANVVTIVVPNSLIKTPE